MMRFREGELFREIESAIRSSLAEYGLIAHLAKDRVWLDDLWQNVCVYLNSCKYGIAVFEEIEEHSFNPNVALELGYMYALGRECLILKDERISVLPADIMGKLYKPIDPASLRISIEHQVSNWAATDLRISARSRRGIPYVVGISGSSRSTDTSVLCRVLGLALARQWYRIISGGAHGAGLDVSQIAYEYFKVAIPWLADDGITFVLTSTKKRSIMPFGKVIEVADSKKRRGELARAAWGTIFIGGDKETWEEYQALKRFRTNPLHRLVIPLGFTGGTARRIWDEIAPSAEELYRGAITIKEFAVLNDENVDAEKAISVVIKILEYYRSGIH